MTDAPVSIGEAPPKPLRPTWPRRGIWSRVPGALASREIAQASRRWGTYWVRFGVLAVMLVVLVITFGNVRPGDNDRGASSIVSAQEMQQIAPGIMLATIWFEFVVLGLMSPGLTAMSICGERRAGTLWALLSTPLKSWEIAMGKVLAGGAQALVLALLPLPVLLAVRVFGGVSAQTLVLSVAVVLSTSVCGLMCGLAASIGAKSASRAGSGGIGLFLLQQFGAAMFISMANALAVTQFSTTLFGPGWYSWVLPVSVLGEITQSEVSPLGSATLPVILGLRAVAWNLGWAAVLFVSSAWRIRRVAARGDFSLPREKSRRAKRAASSHIDQPAPQASAGSDSAPGAQGRLRRRRGSGAREGISRTVWDNAALWRECAPPLIPSTSMRVVLGLLFIGGLVLEFTRDGLTEPAAHYLVSMPGLMLVVLAATLAGSGTFTSERESRSWDMLMAMPLTARRIVMAKFLGAMRRSWLGFLIVGVHFGLSWLLGNATTLMGAYVLLLMVPATAFGAAVGTLMSLLTRTTQRASGMAMGLLLLLWAGLPLFVGMTNEIVSAGLGNRLADNVGAAFFTLNPMAMMSLVMQRLNWNGKLRSTVDYFGAGQVSYLGLGVGVLVFAAVWGLLSIYVLWLAQARLRALSPRR